MNTATEWNVLRPNLEYTESGKIKPCIHMDQLNPIEQTLLDLLKFYISNSADIREQYTIRTWKLGTRIAIIRNYYYMRFRGPLLDSLITQEFSPK